MKLKVRINFILAVLVALIPFSGFPRDWKFGAEVVLGILICFVTYLIHLQLKRLSRKSEKKAVVTEAFVENVGAPSSQEIKTEV